MPEVAAAIRTHPGTLAVRYGVWVAVPLVLYFLAAHALPKLVPNLAEYTDYYWPRRGWLWVHDIAGLAATLLGPWQFVSALRQRQPTLHHWIGRTYLAFVFVCAACAFVLAFTSAVSDAYMLGLCVVAFIWVATGVEAYRYARAGAFVLHREWMVRNYVITLFFVLFFAVLDIARWFGVSDTTAIASWGAWLCWVVPLFATEFLVRGAGPVTRAP